MVLDPYEVGEDKFLLNRVGLAVEVTGRTRTVMSSVVCDERCHPGISVSWKGGASGSYWKDRVSGRQPQHFPGTRVTLLG